MIIHPLNNNRFTYFQDSAANSTLSLMIRYIYMNIQLGPMGLTSLNKAYEVQAEADVFAFAF